MKKICMLLAVFLTLNIWIPASHADAAEEKKPTLYLEYVSRSDDVVTFELRFDDPVGVVLTQLNLFMRYSDNVTLVSCEKICRYGMSITSINPTDNPYQMIWVWGDRGLPKGKTAIFSLDFKLSEDFGEEDTVDFELWYNPEDLPADVPGNHLSEIIMLKEQSSFKDSDMQRCSPVAGDVNSDGNITLTDVSEILKYIAAWDIEFNTRVADALYDGKVNLSDVSIMLKYIAKWDGVRLGHNDVCIENTPSTCKVKGYAEYECSACGDKFSVELELLDCDESCDGTRCHEEKVQFDPNFVNIHAGNYTKVDIVSYTSETQAKRVQEAVSEVVGGEVRLHQGMHPEEYDIVIYVGRPCEYFQPSYDSYSIVAYGNKIYIHMPLGSRIEYGIDCFIETYVSGKECVSVPIGKPIEFTQWEWENGEV